MARGSANTVGYFVKLSAEVSIMSGPTDKMMTSIMHNYEKLLYPTKMSSRNGRIKSIDVRWEYAGRQFTF